MIQFANRIENIKEYYFSTKLKEVNELISNGKPVINMGIGSPDLLPPKAAIKALKESLSDNNAHKYQSYYGLPEFREAVSSFYKNHYSVIINNVNEVIPLMGSKEGILHISLALINEGDKVLIPNPGYPTYNSVTTLVGGKSIFYELNEENNYLPNFSQIEKEDLSNVKLMWISYPHMPTGAKASKKDFEEIVAFGKKHNILIVNDNPYSFILNENPTSIFQAEGAKEIALELNSLSKTFNMAGWRVGMLLGKSDYLKQILKVKTQQDSGMFYAVQKGAIEALKTPKEWLKNLNYEYNERQRLVYELADKLGCSYQKDTAGLFAWSKLPNNKKAEEMVDELLYEKNIFVAPGTIFGTKGEGYIRLSLCVPQEKIKEATQRI